MRIGIDVGGTHTDAVLLDGDQVLASTKALTSADVMGGVTNALDTVLEGRTQSDISAVMIGTTQFTNAVIERRELSPVAAIRIALPAGRGLPPMADWPKDMREAMGAQSYMLRGGYLYDGHPMAELDMAEIDATIDDIKARGLTNIAIASAFSPMNDSPEQIVGERVRAAIPQARITLSSQFGRLGLLERENAAILNTTLLPFAERVVDAFLNAMTERGLTCPIYISQNDGTLMGADFVRQFPALTFASGPTNSLRGAYKLTGLKDAIVVDIGGTTSDIGVLQDGFPRESAVIVDIGGVRTNFRMPDILAVGMGGGSHVSADGSTIGPQSVGHRLVAEGLVFGGQTLTTTDILVASGGADIGNADHVAGLDKDMVARAHREIHAMLDRNIEMMKPGGKPMPVILVGGGSVLVTDGLDAASSLHRPDHAGVANAIGAAIAQIGGEAERLVIDQPRDEALTEITREASDKAVQAGAELDTIRVVDIEETAIPYMEAAGSRIRVKVIGEIKTWGGAS